MARGILMISNLQAPVSDLQQAGKEFVRKLNALAVFKNSPWNVVYNPAKHYDPKEYPGVLPGEVKEPEQLVLERQNTGWTEPYSIEIYRKVIAINFDWEYNQIFQAPATELYSKHRKLTFEVIKALGGTEGIYLPTDRYKLAKHYCDIPEIEDDYARIKQNIEKEFPLQKNTAYELSWLDRIDSKIFNLLHFIDTFEDLKQGKEKAFYPGHILAKHSEFDDMDKKVRMLADYLKKNIKYQVFDSVEKKWINRQYNLEGVSESIYIKPQSEHYQPDMYRWNLFDISDEQGLPVFQIFHYSYRSHIKIPDFYTFLQQLKNPDAKTREFIDDWLNKLRQEMQIFGATKAVYIHNFALSENRFHDFVQKEFEVALNNSLKKYFPPFSLTNLFSIFSPVKIFVHLGLSAFYFNMKDYISKKAHHKINDKIVLIIVEFDDKKS